MIDVHSCYTMNLIHDVQVNYVCLVFICIHITLSVVLSLRRIATIIINIILPILGDSLLSYFLVLKCCYQTELALCVTVSVRHSFDFGVSLIKLPAVF